jgi:hypothetical protein
MVTSGSLKSLLLLVQMPHTDKEIERVLDWRIVNIGRVDTSDAAT